MIKKIYVIAGATASGKSDLAVRLARSIGGDIVNADSVQVYADLPTLTARPTQADMHGIAHHLYGFLDCHATCSVTDWLDKAVATLNTLDHPVVVGGTGLYLRALTEGLSPIPDIDPVVREKVRQMPMDEVRAKVCDCAATDPQRLRRALEVQFSTGKPLSYFQKLPPIQKITANFEILWIDLPRDEIRRRCHDRFLKMLEHGAVDEVKSLIAKHPTGGVTKAIGFKEISAYLNGKISHAEMVDLAVTATRQYAKRQNTWFKNQLKNPKIINNPLDFNI